MIGIEIACAGTGQDGEIQAGVTLPSPRFTDNADGTVTDNGTGLIWLKDGSCLPPQDVWLTAFTVVQALASGNLACSLTDGSAAGDWRLPNVKEYMRLMDLGGMVPNGVLPPGNPFINFNASNYLTSTTLANAPERMWFISMSDGQAQGVVETGNGGHITAVRGPK